MEELATQNALAVTTESAPVTEAPVAVNPAESAPVEATPSENTVPGSEPQSGAVKELISQRKRRQEAEKEAAYWKGRAEAAGSKPEVEHPVVAPVTAQKPVLDDYETYEEYEEAKEVYLIEQAEQRVLSRFQQKEVQQKDEAVQKTFWQKVEKQSDADPYLRDEIQNVAQNVSNVVSSLVVQSEVGVELVKYLNGNIAEARRISALPPILAAKELGVIEARIQYAPKPVPPKQVSAAPEPIQTVAPAGAVTVDEGDLPMEEYHRRVTARKYGKNPF